MGREGCTEPGIPCGNAWSLQMELSLGWTSRKGGSGNVMSKGNRGGPWRAESTRSVTFSPLPRAASDISQFIITIFQRQILREGGEEEKPSQGPLPW